jgi:hypothetical protein
VAVQPKARRGPEPVLQRAPGFSQYPAVVFIRLDGDQFCIGIFRQEIDSAATDVGPAVYNPANVLFPLELAILLLKEYLADHPHIAGSVSKEERVRIALQFQLSQSDRGRIPPSAAT